jgi:predicted dehydrogenase
MTQEQIRIGIVGADTNASWAKVSHVPAINGLPSVRLAAVATRSERSARDAPEAFGADRWYSDPFAMIRDDRIDIATIAVKVPAHRELVLMALAAGKMAYCEAPLGRSVAETEGMARAVHSHHTAIGLQGRLNPAVRRAAELVSSGRIGRPRALTGLEGGHLSTWRQCALAAQIYLKVGYCKSGQPTLRRYCSAGCPENWSLSISTISRSASVSSESTL